MMHTAQRTSNFRVHTDIHGIERVGPKPARQEKKWYDPVVQFTTGQAFDGCNYSDRLWEVDYLKHNQLCLKFWSNASQWWDDRSPESIQLFLREFLGHPELVLVQVEKMYNVSNGFPLWAFKYQMVPNANV